VQTVDDPLQKTLSVPILLLHGFADNRSERSFSRFSESSPQLNMHTPASDLQTTKNIKWKCLVGSLRQSESIKLEKI
jgi:hypothetical protein